MFFLKIFHHFIYKNNKTIQIEHYRNGIHCSSNSNCIVPKMFYFIYSLKYHVKFILTHLHPPIVSVFVQVSSILTNWNMLEQLF